MANIFDNKTDNRVVREGWNDQQLFSRTSYIRSQSENQGTKALDSLELPAKPLISEPSTQGTPKISRKVSAPSLCLAGDLPKLLEQTPLMLRKTMCHSDTELRGSQTELVAINNERNDSILTNKPGLERKGFSNQTIPKGRNSLKRRASLPPNHLGEYLSVNNIRKRAQNGGTTSDSDRDVASANKVKNTNRRKLRLPSAEEPHVNENPAEETIVVNEVDNAPENDIEDNSRPKIAVRNVS